MKIYLAHPWMNLDYGTTLTAFLEAEGFEIINPFRDIEQGQGIEGYFQPELEIIPKMYALIVVVTDHGRATHMEAFYAWTKGVPVFVMWLASDNRYSWYEKIATAIVSDSNELLEALRKYEA